MKVLLTGSNGQLGQAIISNVRNATKGSKIKLIPLTRKDFDLTNIDECKRTIDYYKPDWLLNAAAYTLVDKAESEPEKVYQVNSYAPGAFVDALEAFGGRLLQISTDFIFNGKQGSPYLINQPADPLGVYGLSKAKGEQAALQSIRSLVLRTSWVYGPIGKNFLLTMLRLHTQQASNKKSLKVVSDQIGVPTSTQSLSQACLRLMSLDSSIEPQQIFHWTDAGVASWYDFAVAIGELGVQYNIISSAAEVIPITTQEYPTPAKRPSFSILDCVYSQEALSLKPLHWRKSLEKVLLSLK